ncbi:radical SAM protein [Lentisphaerota bacterium ZTH]|nr:radical SAM protein [Lentisphaerota bacterium]WET05584.1 radical SAM protein [Lentisphaerota bacterium ZTH]
MKTLPVAAALRAVAWETTKSCSMKCRHCRADAVNDNKSGELSTAEGRWLINGLAEMGGCTLILTGGEPLIRPDIYDLSAYAAGKGIDVVMATCGNLVNPKSVKQMQSSGVRLISISLDGADAVTHDSFRGLNGAYETALDAMRCSRQGKLPFQVNTTVSTLNVEQLTDIYKQVVESGASVWDLFFLVPTGRGSSLKHLEISSAAYEKTLHWVYRLSKVAPLGVKTTCAPHYGRIQRTLAGADFDNIPRRFRARGCLGGKGFLFISSRGIVQPCGFLNLNCGDLRKAGFDIKSIYQDSIILDALRRAEKYTGKCGSCSFVESCGGCRARAFEKTGNFLSEEPNCIYENKK